MPAPDALEAAVAGGRAPHGPPCESRCAIETCAGDKSTHDTNPQEGQGGEAAFASDEPHCYAWGTISVAIDFPLAAEAMRPSQLLASSCCLNSRSLDLNSPVW